MYLLILIRFTSENKFLEDSFYMLPTSQSSKVTRKLRQQDRKYDRLPFLAEETQ